MARFDGVFHQPPFWHLDAVRGPSTPSFDHLIGAGEDQGRDRETERVGGLEVHDESNLIGSWIGRSPCLAPFRMRSTARHVAAIFGSPRASASLLAQSRATQHINLEEHSAVACPRASQMHWSGSRQTRVAQAAYASTIGPERPGKRRLRRVWSRIESRTAPKTSFSR